MKVFLHAGDFGITNIRAIEEGKQVCHEGPLLAEYTSHVIAVVASTIGGRGRKEAGSHKKATRGGRCQSILRNTRLSTSGSTAWVCSAMILSGSWTFVAAFSRSSNC